MRAILLTLALLGAAWRIAASGRKDAFIGYTEQATCRDRLPNCKEKAKQGACLQDPYAVRTFCPISCAVTKCLASGTLRARHNGYASPEDTATFAKRAAQRVSPHTAPRHFRTRTVLGEQLTLSSLGVGTYLGDADSRTDDAVTSAVVYSVVKGWNVIDTASNYRWGRAEVSVGHALDALLAGAAASDFLQKGGAYDGDITRDMLFISTKAGFVDQPLVDRLIEAQSMTQQDVVSGHCMAPAYIKASLEQSLERMNLETVDLLYLHNAAEMQLQALGREGFMARLKEAFAQLEALRGAAPAPLRTYGLATWDCFRVPPTDAGHVNLEDVVQVAKQAAGSDGKHGFAFIQLPVSATMPEAWREKWQTVGGKAVTLMEAAEQLGVGVFTSGPLGEGELVRKLVSRLDGVLELAGSSTTPQKLLQLARSTPGGAMAAALVGHKTREYVVANVALAAADPLTAEEFESASAAVKAVVDSLQ